MAKQPVSQYDAEFDAHERPKDGRHPIAMVNITEIVITSVPVYPTNDGQSFGQIIDAYLSDAAKEGRIVQTVAVEIEKEDWFDMVERLRHP